MKCFVIMPFGDPQKEPERANILEQIYSDWIKPAVESINIPGEPDETISCHRADMSSQPGEIITHVIENLVSADIVIADLSGRNPNVFYELGVRHAVNNNTILISDNLKDVPFDLRGLRTITYEWEPGKMLKLQKSLKSAILEILKEPNRIDNPVRRHLYIKESEKLTKQTAPPGYDVVTNILTEMKILKKAFNDQSTEIKKIFNQITTAQVKGPMDIEAQKYELSFFEGVWLDESEFDTTTFFVKLINNELLIPYLYDDDPSCPAHYYNCKLIGNTLFARFEWFRGEISGYSVLRIVSEDQLVGGWWSKEDIPRQIAQDITLIKETIPGMEPMIWKRIKKKKVEPPWIKEYFEKAKKGIPLKEKAVFKFD